MEIYLLKADFNESAETKKYGGIFFKQYAKNWVGNGYGWIQYWCAQ